MKSQKWMLPLGSGVLMGMTIALPLYAQVFSWNKAEVVPVVLVKPSVGGFVPTEGTTIGNTWSKEEVKPVLIVEPSVGGFVPREGSTIGNTWSKEEVKAVIVVTPRLGNFVPADSTTQKF